MREAEGILDGMVRLPDDYPQENLRGAVKLFFDSGERIWLLPGSFVEVRVSNRTHAQEEQGDE